MLTLKVPQSQNVAVYFNDFPNFTQTNISHLFKDDFQSVLRTLKSLFAFLVLFHVRHHQVNISQLLT